MLSLVMALLLAQGRVGAQQNLLPDPSVEETQPPNRFGIPIASGAAGYSRARERSATARSRRGQDQRGDGGAPGVKMRLYSPPVTVAPGRYRFSCCIRGLDVGVHAWGLSEDVNFADEPITR